MTTHVGLGRETRPSVGAEGLRWGASLALVLGLHAAFGWVMLSHQPPDLVLPAETEAIMLELPPEPVPVQPEVQLSDPVPAPAPPPMPAPPEPTPSAPRPSPEPSITEPRQPEPPLSEIQPPPPTPAPEAVLPLPPPPRPVPPLPAPPRPAPTRRTPLPTPPSRPSSAPALPMPTAPPAAVPPPLVNAPPAATPTSPGSATVTWRSDLVSKLARAKRYPEAARTRGEQGTAMATFTMDRAGHVVSANVTRGSGSYLLDEEAVALIHRAEPLPALPAEIPGATLTLTVPIAFALR